MPRLVDLGHRILAGAGCEVVGAVYLDAQQRLVATLVLMTLATSPVVNVQVTIAAPLPEDQEIDAVYGLSGHWGDLSPGDRTANDLALADGDRLLSSYNLPGGGRLWIITEWDRSATTLLLPEDY